MPMTNIFTRFFMRFRRSAGTECQRRDEVMKTMRNFTRALACR